MTVLSACLHGTRLRLCLLAVGVFLLVLAPGVLSAAPPAPILLWKSSPEAVAKSVHAVPATNAERSAVLKQYFDRAGCRGKDIAEQTVAGSEGRNIVCTLPGSGPEVIVVAAHYELEGQGASAVDDWTGAFMLPLVYKALAATVRSHTFVFAEFAGSAGARTYVNGLSKAQRKSVLGTVGLEGLGVGALQFWSSPNDDADMLAREEALGGALQAAAFLTTRKQLEVAQMWDSFKVDDTAELHHAGIPAILVHSVPWGDRKLPGSADDTSAAIDGDHYYAAYRLISTYCAELDQTLDDRLHRASDQQRMAPGVPAPGPPAH